MRSSFRLALPPFLFFWSLSASFAFAWGRDGHEAIGYLAASLIAGTNAETQVAALLKPGETLATATEWADCAKGWRYCQAPLTQEMKDFGIRNPQHHAYHYTDIPFQLADYNSTEIGTTPDDIVHVLQDAILILQNKPPIDSSHDLTQREALFILAHMTGDIHQPLHVGASFISNNKYIVPATEDKANKTSNRGGNWLCVGAKPFHGLWDTDYVKRAMQNAEVDTSESFAEKLSELGHVKATSKTAIRWPEQWATETLALAKAEFSNIKISSKRLQGPEGSCSQPKSDKPSPGNMWTLKLPDGYADHAAQEIVPDQLHKAGVRLANLLKAIWP